MDNEISRELQSSLARTLERNCQLAQGRLSLLGLSGGPDSLALLDLLWRLDFPLVAAHLDHGLRPESAAEAEVVREFCRVRTVPCVIERADLGSETEAGALEERAREARYAFLFSKAQEHTAQAVVVAHNADDQVETVLMHLLRGAGLDGLAGMSFRSLPNPWSETIPLVRPLLGTWRQQIEAYLAEQDLQAIFDRSNLDTTFFRNRLRHALIPELETYIPGVRARLWQTADLLSAERQVMEHLSAQTWESVAHDLGADYVGLDRAELLAQPLGLQRRLVRLAINRLQPGARDVEFALVERVLAFCEKPTDTGQADIGLRLLAFDEGQYLYLAANRAHLPRQAWPQISQPEVLAMPGELALGAGWLLKASLVPASPQLWHSIRTNQDPDQAWVDIGPAKQALRVRPRRQGEQFQPLGMGGQSVNLADFMLNQKMPRRARAHWPLVCLGSEIVWIPGYRLAEAFKVRPESQQIAHLQLLRR